MTKSHKRTRPDIRRMTADQYASMEAKATAIVISTVARSLAAQGLISTTGKTRREVEFEAVKYYAENPFTLALVTDHAPTILSRARAEIRSQEWTLAVLFVALFFEHWINGVLSLRAERLRLNARHIDEILRADNKLKWGLLLKLLHLPAIAPARIRQIEWVTNLRNEFVHYKYKAHAEDEELARRCEAAVTGVDGTIKYLQRYETRHIYSSAKLLSRWRG
jgi:hypothetical protein